MDKKIEIPDGTIRLNKEVRTPFRSEITFAIKATTLSRKTLPIKINKNVCIPKPSFQGGCLEQHEEV